MAFIANKRLLEYLERRIGENVVLYSADSYAYYGRLTQVDCCSGLLTPGSGQSAVVVRNPDQTFSSQGTGVEFESSTFVNLCTIVAVTDGLTEIPPGFTFCVIDSVSVD